MSTSIQKSSYYVYFDTKVELLRQLRHKSRVTVLTLIQKSKYCVNIDLWIEFDIKVDVDRVT